ncbi:hypothetical protein [Paracoccus sp. (in: a-proteobacteria)]|uniref:hypothetical protein n=1 Tax=Paracoccus sp. TaxID=267 RepID=UPI0026E0A4EB|nr:hypothetical protein [Paracoccus sp. (in: a-proteobacteria)]MDO5647373.1 hypothetical protein [Paracoccus sp. (in: a-proteobacteria)]
MATLEEILAEAKAEASQILKKKAGPIDESISGPFNGWGAAFKQGIDQPAERMADTAAAYGLPGEQTLRGLVEATPGYDSASGRFMNGDGPLGFGWEYLPKAGAEQLGNLAGAALMRSGGAAVGTAVGGPIGGIVGGVAAPVIFEGAQVAGPTAMARAQNDGREDLTTGDRLAGLGTAAASGALNTIPLGRKGALRRAGSEGGTEAGQSVVQQTGETLGTESGFHLDMKEAVGEGIMGVGTMASMDAVAVPAKRGVNVVTGQPGTLFSRVDNDGYDHHDQALRDRIRDNQNTDDQIAKVNTTDSQDSAQGLAKGVLKDLREEAKILAMRLRKDAKDPALEAQLASLEADLTDGPADRFAHSVDALTSVVNTALGQSGNMKSAVSDRAIQRIGESFPGNPDAYRLMDVLTQTQRLTQFTDAKGDLGGLNQWTRLLDPFDGRSGIGRMGIPLHGLAGPAGVGTFAGGVAVNRTARFLDNLTNRRSRLKRYVESVEHATTKGLIPPRDTSEMDALIEKARAAQAMRDGPLDPSNGQPDGTPPRDPQGPQHSLAWQATESMFRNDRTDLHNDYEKGHRKWELATGKGPRTIYNELTKMESEGLIPHGTAVRFRADIKSFTKNDNEEAVHLQAMIRDRINPGHSYNKALAADLAKSPEAILKKLDASKTGINNNRGTQKAREGARQAQNTVAAIEARKDHLDHHAYDALMALKNAIDRPDMTDADRHELVTNTLGRLFPNPADYSHWAKEFSGLVRVGNDYRIQREDADPKADPKERKLSARKKAVKAQNETGKMTVKEFMERHHANLNAAPASWDANGQGSFDLQGGSNKPYEYVRPVDEILKDLEARAKEREADPDQLEFGFDADPATKAVAQDEPKVGPQPKKGNRNSLKNMVDDRIDAFADAKALAETYGDLLSDRMSQLDKSPSGRVEALFYELATERLSVNMLADAFIKKHVPEGNVQSRADALQTVMGVLTSWANQGVIKLIQPARGGDVMKSDGKVITDAKKKALRTLKVQILDPDLNRAVQAAQAIRMVGRMASPDGPEAPFTVDNPQVGRHKAFKKPTEVNDTHQPILNAINGLQERPIAYSSAMLRQIEAALNGGRPGVLKDWLRPVVDEGKKKGDKSTTKPKPKHDESPLRALSQILYLHGKDGERSHLTTHQAWSVDDRGRLYAGHGSASSQGGDLMKGLVKTDQRYPTGGPSGLNYMLHSFGNLLGVDKKSPYDRRAAIFEGDTISRLIHWAANPTGRDILTDRGGKTTRLGEIVGNAEGPFQALGVANEVASMAAWAKARHREKAKTMGPSALLQDPEVQADIAQSYTTDWVVQLDGSNNALQLSGLLTGSLPELEATGLSPRDPNADPDRTAAPDAYLDSGLRVAQRVPELLELDLPNSLLRKVFKKAVGTRQYDTSPQTRTKSFQAALEEIADGASLWGVGKTAGLMQIPRAREAALLSPEGLQLSIAKYDSDGEYVSDDIRRWRVVKDDGKWFVETDDTKKGGRWKRKSICGFGNSDAAVISVQDSEFFGRLERETVRDFARSYPGASQFLQFSQSLTKILKDHPSIKVPLPDGAVLEWKPKETPTFEGHMVPFEGREVYLGINTGETKKSSRGFGAFAIHAMDAYVARESHRRMSEDGDLKIMNLIHDSFGFHPAQAEKGQATVLEVMQELGNGDYNYFVEILIANGIDPEVFESMGGVLPERKAVEPKPASMLPTAVS